MKSGECEKTKPVKVDELLIGAKTHTHTFIKGYDGVSNLE